MYKPSFRIQAGRGRVLLLPPHPLQHGHQRQFDRLPRLRLRGAVRGGQRVGVPPLHLHDALQRLPRQHRVHTAVARLGEVLLHTQIRHKRSFKRHFLDH